MKAINNPNEVIFSRTGGDTLLVIANEELQNLNEVWNDDKDIISLKDISDIFPHGCMIVIYESPLEGKVFRYSNYSDETWWETGKTDGYA